MLYVRDYNQIKQKKRKSDGMSQVENSDEKMVSEWLPLYILYYCHILGDTTKYTLNLKGVADIDYSLDEYGTTMISAWKLPYSQPTPAMLRSFKFKTVKKWYKRNYEVPARILNNEGVFPQINTEDMQDMAVSELVYTTNIPVVFNTTYKKLFYFDKDLRGWKLLQ